MVYNAGANEWVQGTISNEKYITLPKSSLAAIYNQCRHCANTTILAYQDANGYVQVANKSLSGWTVRQLGLDAYNGTGLALQPFYRSDLQDQINLYYQSAELNITLASLDPRPNAHIGSMCQIHTPVGGIY